MALKVDSALFTASALDVARSRGSASPSLLPVSSATWARTSPGRSARVTGRSSAPVLAFLLCSDAISEARRGVARGYFLPRGWAPVGCFKGLTALYPRDSGQMHSQFALFITSARGTCPSPPRGCRSPSTQSSRGRQETKASSSRGSVTVVVRVCWLVPRRSRYNTRLGREGSQGIHEGASQDAETADTRRLGRS